MKGLVYETSVLDPDEVRMDYLYNNSKKKVFGFSQSYIDNKIQKKKLVGVKMVFN